MSRITQLSSTSRSVINLGQVGHVPLIRLSSELADGLEPHDHIYSPDTARAAAVQCGSGVRWGGGVPGVCAVGGYREGAIPGTNPPVSPRPSLRLIYRYIEINRFIRPFEASFRYIIKI